MRDRTRKLRLISLSATFVLLAGYSATALACSPPSWWPSWLPYYCQER